MVNETQQNNEKAKKCSQVKLNCITIYSTTEKNYICMLYVNQERARARENMQKESN